MAEIVKTLNANIVCGFGVFAYNTTTVEIDCKGLKTIIAVVATPVSTNTAGLFVNEVVVDGKITVPATGKITVACDSTTHGDEDYDFSYVIIGY